MNSFWCKDVEIPEFETLDGNADTEVLIIGGGLVGVLTAYYLEKENVPYMLVEAEKIASKTTSRTTAKITAQHGIIYEKLIKDFGEENAYLYLKANLDAVEEYARLSKNIDCDFKRADSFVYSMDNTETLKREVIALKRLGFPAEFEKQTELPFSVSGAVKMPNQANFNPMKFIGHISKNLNIYENTKVQEFFEGGVMTNRGKITAKKIVITTHFPILNKHGAYFLKLYQERSYVLALKNAEKLSGMYIDEAKGGLSFRNYGDILLLGGGGHRTGKNGSGWAELEEFAGKYYPNAKIIDRFATQDPISLDSVAYIGKYSKNTENLFVATGFNKWGMTTSMVAAKILTDLILGRQNKFAKVFSPHRSILKPQLLINAAESVLGLLTPTAPRCPHLGCALKYNKAEHSWDCSCHGSRFSEKGELLNNPATDDIFK